MARTVHVQLGRLGDLVLLLPCWHQRWVESGEKPVVVVAREFAGVLEGASYVEPEVVNVNWWTQMAEAKRLAELKYGEYVVTQCHAVGHGCDMGQTPTFGELMWVRAGYPGRYGSLPMVFDRRNREREDQLVRRYADRRGRPLLLYNFNGLSAPLPAGQDLRRRLKRWEQEFRLLDLGPLRAERFYDLLGLYEKAAGLITIDTATMHLAAACAVPMLAYTPSRWSCGIPKPGTVELKYEQAHARLDVLDRFVESLK